MRLEHLRWILLPAAVAVVLAMALKGATAGRLAFGAVCALAWWGLSRRKVHSLDRDRFEGGKLGRRS